LATAWTVNYEIFVPLADAQAVLATAKALETNSATFASTLANTLTSAGVDPAVLAQSFQLSSFSAVAFQIIDAPAVSWNVQNGTSFQATNLPLCGRQLIATVEATSLDIAKDLVFTPFTHFLVYTASNFSEQSFPSVLLIVDTMASASQVAFVDLDLDGNELGGAVQWSPPLEVSAVQDYVVYLGISGRVSKSFPTGSGAIGENPNDHSS